MDIQSKKKKLMRKQQIELQNQQVKEMLEIFKSQQDKEKIQELESEQEMLQSIVNALSEKERTANDELEDARKVAIEVSVSLTYKDVHHTQPTPFLFFVESTALPEPLFVSLIIWH